MTQFGLRFSPAHSHLGEVADAESRVWAPNRWISISESSLAARRGIHGPLCGPVRRSDFQPDSRDTTQQRNAAHTVRNIACHG